MEHVCLLKAKQSLLSEEKEKDMLDYLYTSQYQMRGIVAISVGEPPSTPIILKSNLYRFSFTLTGSIGDKSSGDFTHALFVRFQRKEDLEMFYENPLFLKVLNEHVTPFCHVCPLTCKTPFLSVALSSRLLIPLVLLYLDVSSLMLQGLINVDYESEVEDDILSIFRKGEV